MRRSDREVVAMADYWAYIRVSTTKTEQELSLEEQERWARLQADKDKASIRIWRERASAKSVIGRRIFSSLIHDLEELPAARRPRRLLVTSFDRLSRDMTDTLVGVRSLERLKVELFVRDQGAVSAKTFPEQAALVGQSLGGQAENWARSQRMKASFERRRREGKVTCNKPPYGLQVIKERFVPIDDSAAWVRKAFKLYADGWGSMRIADLFKRSAPPHTITRLQPDGRQRITRHAPLWVPQRVLRLLRQGKYRGTIVNEGLFDRVQRVRDSRQRERRLVFEYPLSGCLRCTCGRKMAGTASGGGGSVYRTARGKAVRYEKYKRTRYYRCEPCKLNVNADRAEKDFRKAVGVLEASDRDLRAWVLEKPDLDAGLNTKREIATLERRLTPELIEATRSTTWKVFYAGKITENQLRAQLNELERAEKADRTRLEELRRATDTRVEAKRTLEQARDLLRNFWPLFDRAPYARKRELISTLLDCLGVLRIDRSHRLMLSKPSRTEALHGVSGGGVISAA